MLDILTTVPGKKRQTPSGWYSFNAICCHNRGHRADTRGRAGLIFTNVNEWSYSCFNCHFKCSFRLGRLFSQDLKSLLTWCGLDRDKIDKLSFENFTQRSTADLYVQKHHIPAPEFKEKPLPENARLLDPLKDTEHVEYLTGRGLSVEDYPFYVVDDEPRKRIIVPFFYKGKIVGNTSRYYDNRHPKYISDMTKGYVFNIDAQEPKYQVCILVEGPFDALSIGGCAYLGSTINDDQAALLKGLRRTIIVVPDRDKAGLAVCDRALELGFKISLPEWADDVKDANDAIRRYGKLPTLLSILQSATSSRIIVEMKRKKLA